MTMLALGNLAIEGVAACLPARAEDNLAACAALFGDEAKAAGVVKTSGVRTRRVAAPGTSSLDLCCAAAKRVLADCAVVPDEIGAVVCVTFTPERAMPCNACQAQSRLGLPASVLAFDLGLACSGYPYGLYVAGLLARETGKRVLLLDGDVQTPRLRPDDAATRPVLADAGSATLVAPAPGAPAWRFAFHSDGAKGDALSFPVGGSISMDGFGVFRFVASDVVKFLKGFLAECPAAPDAFAPHQANVYLVRQLASSLGVPPEKTWISADVFGNSASASVPVTIAHCAPPGGVGALLLAGFGGGLSASAALVPFRGRTAEFDYE